MLSFLISMWLLISFVICVLFGFVVSELDHDIERLENDIDE